MYLVTPCFGCSPRSTGHKSKVNKSRHILPQSVPAGLLGLMVAALFHNCKHGKLSANVFAGVLTNDFYRPILNPKANDKKLVAVGRNFTAIIGILLIVMAILIPAMGGAEKVIITINALLVVPLFAPTLWGVFSKKIGIKQMLIVALTSFGIGVLLRFGLPAVTEKGDPLWGLTNYVLNNKKMVELFVGVLLPVCMLFLFEVMLRSTDKGAKRLDTKRSESHAVIAAAEKRSSFDPFPAQMVMYSVLLLGAWMLFIGFREPEERTVLMSVGCGLLVLSGVINVFVGKIKAQKRSTMQ